MSSMPTSKKIKWMFTRRQSLAYRTLKLPETEEECYGGAKGGGKSVFGTRWILLEADEIIERFQLKPTDTPPLVGFLGRKRAVDFTKTTLETLKREWPRDRYRIKEQAREIIVDDRVKFFYGGFDDTESINKFNSGEYVIVFIDQAEELGRDDAGMIRGTMRGKIQGEDWPRKILWTANPRRGWLKEEFIDRKIPGYRFIQALPSDNPFLPKDYIKKLKMAFGHRPELLAAYLDGSWEAFEEPNQILYERLIKEACNRRFMQRKKVTFIVCDPARFGDDESVVYLFENTDIIDQKIFGKIPDDRLNLEIHKWALEVGAVAVVIDEGGLGGPIVDWQRRLAGDAYRVMGINSAQKADDEELYHNKRAEVWFACSKMFQEGEIALSTNRWMGEDDWRCLVNELCIVLYEFRGKRILVESKDDIKKPDRLGHSPNRADTAVMGWYAYPRIARRKQKIKKKPSEYNKRMRRQSAWAS